MNKHTEQVMIDLETLGQRSDSAIMSIGAVKFSVEKGIISKFYQNVDPKGQREELGRRVEQSTVEWWSKQNKEVRDALKVDRRSLKESLNLFCEWYGNKDRPIWGNGASFDLVIIENALFACDMIPPWTYKNHRCLRTIRALFPIDYNDNRVGNLHNALDDAVTQTNYLLKILSVADEE